MSTPYKRFFWIFLILLDPLVNCVFMHSNILRNLSDILTQFGH